MEDVELIRTAGAIREWAPPKPVVLNVGSQDLYYRTVRKPNLQSVLIEPLVAAGATFIHYDVRSGEGIDVHGDIFQPETQNRLRRARPDVTLVANVLEHVPDAKSFVDACLAVTPPGSLLVLVVASSYPYHADPIDTGFRPTPAELAALAGDRVDVLDTDEVVRHSLLDTWREEGVSRSLRHVAGILVPRSATVWRYRVDALRWLFRPFRSSLVVLRVRGE